MGESSKTSGENGEKITEELLKLIGWSNLMKGVSIPCNRTAHGKKTHGNDFVFIYDNPSMTAERMLFISHRKTPKMVTPKESKESG